MRSPPVSEWGYTEHRRQEGQSGRLVQIPFVRRSANRPLLFVFQTDRAVPGNLCIPPLNEAECVQEVEGSAIETGNFHVLGFGQAAGRGTAG